MNENSISPSANGSPTAGSDRAAAAANGAHDVVNRVASGAHQAVDRVAAAAGPAIEKLRGTAAAAGDTIKAKADQLGAVEEQWIAGARNYVRDNPLAAVAIAAAVGLLIGKLTGGRDDERPYR